MTEPPIEGRRTTQYRAEAGCLSSRGLNLDGDFDPKPAASYSFRHPTAPAPDPRTVSQAAGRRALCH
jgi:hypothetical protein